MAAPAVRPPPPSGPAVTAAARRSCQVRGPGGRVAPQLLQRARWNWQPSARGTARVAGSVEPGEGAKQRPPRRLLDGFAEASTAFQRSPCCLCARVLGRSLAVNLAGGLASAPAGGRAGSHSPSVLADGMAASGVRDLADRQECGRMVLQALGRGICQLGVQALAGAVLVQRIAICEHSLRQLLQLAEPVETRGAVRAAALLRGELWPITGASVATNSIQPCNWRHYSTK